MLLLYYIKLYLYKAYYFIFILENTFTDNAENQISKDYQYNSHLLNKCNYDYCVC